MKFHELKIAILKYLHFHQKEDYIGIDVLRNELKKSTVEDVDVACKRLIEEGLACRHNYAITGFKSSNSMYKIRITRAGIDFLIDNETSDAGRESNKINRKMLYATVASVLVAVLAIVAGLNFDIILPQKIDLMYVKVVNITAEQVVINPINKFCLWFPSTVGYSFTEGRYEFVADGIIEIPPKESIFL